jgi:hypothetical protein
MTSNLLTNPQYWLDRAEEIRVLAERSVYAETKRMLEKIVSDYELSARRAGNDDAEPRETTALTRHIMGVGFFRFQGKAAWQGVRSSGHQH